MSESCSFPLHIASVLKMWLAGFVLGVLEVFSESYLWSRVFLNAKHFVDCHGT